MRNGNNPAEELTDADVARLLKVATDLPDVIDDLEALTELQPRELWEEIFDRWKRLGLRWSDDTAARLFGVTELTLKRWRRRKELPGEVRKRIAAFSELVALIACGKLAAINDQDLRRIVKMLRGLTDNANDDTIEDVLSLLRCQFDELAQPSG